LLPFVPEHMECVSRPPADAVPPGDARESGFEHDGKELFQAAGCC